MCTGLISKYKVDQLLQARSCKSHPGARTSRTTTTENKTASCSMEVVAGSGMTSAATSITFTGSVRAVSEILRNFVYEPKKNSVRIFSPRKFAVSTSN